MLPRLASCADQWGPQLGCLLVSDSEQQWVMDLERPWARMLVLRWV